MAESKLIVTIAGQFESLDKATKGAIATVKNMGSTMSSLGSAAALGISAPIAAFSAVALKSAGDLEALKLGLTAVTGSAKAAETQFNSLREVAKLPGLGLQEAVQGAVNLQALGFSADKSKNLLLQFGNALATVGRGKEDLSEVIRQLGQLGARGVVTADNLKPLIERVPQLAGIIKRNFGAEAIGNPAETFKKLGVSSQEFIAIVEAELGKLPRVAGGLKNDFENIQDSATIAFAKAGEAIAPFAKIIIDDFAVPAINKIAQLADVFKSLPGPVQTAAVALGGITAGTPLIIGAIGSMLTNLALLTEAFKKAGGASGVFSIALAKSPWVALALATAYAGSKFLDFRESVMKAIDEQKDLEKAFDGTISKLRLMGVAVDESNRFKFITRPGMMLAGEDAEVVTNRRGTESTKEFIDYLSKLAVAHNVAGGGATSDGGDHDDFTAAIERATAAVRKAEHDYLEHAKVLQKTAKDQALLNGTLLADPSEVRARAIGILNEQHSQMIDTLAKFRLGLVNMWDGLPQFDEAAVKIHGLGDEFSYVGGAARRAAAEIKLATMSSDLSKLDVLQNKQRGDVLEGQFKAAVKNGEEAFKTSATQAKRYAQQVSLIANDIARNITDLTFKGGKLGDVLKGTFVEIGKGIQRSLLETQLKRITQQLVDITTKAPAVQKALKDLFGLGADTATKAAKPAVDAAGNVINAATPATSAVSSVAGSALSGWIGAISSAVTAVSSVVSNFQFAAMNKSLDIIVKHTLQAANQLIYGLQPQINTYLPFLKLIHERLSGFSTITIPSSQIVSISEGVAQGAAQGAAEGAEKSGSIIGRVISNLLTPFSAFKSIGSAFSKLIPGGGGNDAMVGLTLQIANQLTMGIQPALNTYLPYLKLIHERSFEAGFAGAGGGGQVINVYVSNNTFGSNFDRSQIDPFMNEITRRVRLAIGR